MPVGGIGDILAGGAARKSLEAALGLVDRLEDYTANILKQRQLARSLEEIEEQAGRWGQPSRRFGDEMDIVDIAPRPLRRGAPTTPEELILEEMEQAEWVKRAMDVGDGDFGADPRMLEMLHQKHRERFGLPMLHGGMRGVMDLAPYLATAYALSQAGE